VGDKPVIAWEFGFDLYNAFGDRVASGLFISHPGNPNYQLLPGREQSFLLDLFNARLFYTRATGDAVTGSVGTVRLRFADGSIWTAPGVNLPE
jgi:hypothetical protein